MRCSCAMMSPKVTSPEEEGGADVDGQKGMELNEREELLNPTAATKAGPRYV